MDTSRNQLQLQHSRWTRL